MLFSNKDNALIKNLYQFKSTVYGGYWLDFRRQTEKGKDWTLYKQDSANRKCWVAAARPGKQK